MNRPKTGGKLMYSSTTMTWHIYFPEWVRSGCCRQQRGRRWWRDRSFLRSCPCHRMPVSAGVTSNLSERERERETETERDRERQRETEKLLEITSNWRSALSLVEESLCTYYTISRNRISVRGRDEGEDFTAAASSRSMGAVALRPICNKVGVVPSRPQPR